MLLFFEDSLVAFGDAAWGTPLLVLLLGGGTFFLLFVRARPYFFLAHALSVLFGKHDSQTAPGQISHFQALSTALSATIGLGNISGVAVAVATGGPGALFWMWVSAIVGTATKFFTCTLAVMYRGQSAGGRLTGGPMYYIREGLGERYRPLAFAFALLGVLGCLPLVVANQLVRVLHELAVVPSGLVAPGHNQWSYLGLGLLLAALTAIVVFGGLPRLAKVAARLVPAMVLGYLCMAGAIIVGNAARVPEVLGLVLQDAFTGEAVAGGSLGTVMLIGIRRGAFSNEAGVGTEAMAHGEARTSEPVREGLVAMLGPMIDTLLVCSATGFAILLSGISLQGNGQGVELTLAAFRTALPTVAGVSLGALVLGLACAIFGLTTLFGYSYYGGKCLEYVAGTRLKHPYRWYNWLYVASIVVCAPLTLRPMMGFLDGCFALMAWPTMLGALLLAPKVRAAADDYFDRLQRGQVRE